MRLYLVRHGRTAGNLEKRYVGRTDEPLLDSERQRLCEVRERLAGTASTAGAALSVRRVIASPMRRCLETAACLWPDAETVVSEGLREMDFGAYEYANYEELRDKAGYQHFLDTMGESGFPGGESRAAFAGRVCRAFAAAVRSLDEEAALAVHGGTIMALMAVLYEPKRDYYDWMAQNGGGYAVDLAFRGSGDDAVPVLTHAEELALL